MSNSPGFPYSMLLQGSKSPLNHTAYLPEHRFYSLTKYHSHPQKNVKLKNNLDHNLFLQLFSPKNSRPALQRVAQPAQGQERQWSCADLRQLKIWPEDDSRGLLAAWILTNSRGLGFGFVLFVLFLSGCAVKLQSIQAYASVSSEILRKQLDSQDFSASWSFYPALISEIVH